MLSQPSESFALIAPNGGDRFKRPNEAMNGSSVLKIDSCRWILPDLNRRKQLKAEHFLEKINLVL